VRRVLYVHAVGCRWCIDSVTTRSTACARRYCSSIREAEVAWWRWYRRYQRRSCSVPTASIYCVPEPWSPSTQDVSPSSTPFSVEVTSSNPHTIRFYKRSIASHSCSFTVRRHITRRPVLYKRIFTEMAELVAASVTVKQRSGVCLSVCLNIPSLRGFTA